MHLGVQASVSLHLSASSLTVLGIKTCSGDALAWNGSCVLGGFWERFKADTLGEGPKTNEGEWGTPSEIWPKKRRLLVAAFGPVFGEAWATVRIWL